MGIQYNPRIVTDGLVLALDAGNTKSYPSTPNIPVALTGVGNTPTNLFDNNVNSITGSSVNSSLTWTGNIFLGTGKYYLILSAWGLFSQGPGSVTLTFGGVNYTTDWATIRSNTDFLGQTIGQGGTFPAGAADGRRTNLTPLGSGALTSIVSSATGGGFPNQFYAVVFVPSGVSDTNFANHVVVTNSLAYPTTWTDLSGRGNTGTLTNGPTYSSANGGSIVFDGVDDSLPTLLSTNTFTNTTQSVWFKWNGTNQSSVIIYLGNSNGNGFGLYIGTSGTPSNLLSVLNGGSIFNALSSYVTLTTNWTNFALTRNSTTTSLYQNGSLFASAATTPISAASYSFLGNSNAGGNISNISFYNRALSAAEISQNFNALRGRYGI